MVRAPVSCAGNGHILAAKACAPCFSRPAVCLTLDAPSAAGLTPGNFSPSAFFLDGSPSNAANLSALSVSALSATGSKSQKALQSPPMSDLKEVCCTACCLRSCCSELVAGVSFVHSTLVHVQAGWGGEGVDTRLWLTWCARW